MNIIAKIGKSQVAFVSFCLGTVYITVFFLRKEVGLQANLDTDNQ